MEKFKAKDRQISGLTPRVRLLSLSNLLRVIHLLHSTNHNCYAIYHNDRYVEIAAIPHYFLPFIPAFLIVEKTIAMFSL